MIDDLLIFDSQSEGTRLSAECPPLAPPFLQIYVVSFYCNSSIWLFFFFKWFHSPDLTLGVMFLSTCSSSLGFATVCCYLGQQQHYRDIFLGAKTYFEMFYIFTFINTEDAEVTVLHQVLVHCLHLNKQHSSSCSVLLHGWDVSFTFIDWHKMVIFYLPVYLKPAVLYKLRNSFWEIHIDILILLWYSWP